MTQANTPQGLSSVLESTRRYVSNDMMVDFMLYERFKDFPEAYIEQGWRHLEMNGFNQRTEGVNLTLLSMVTLEYLDLVSVISGLK